MILLQDIEEMISWNSCPGQGMATQMLIRSYGLSCICFKLYFKILNVPGDSSLAWSCCTMLASWHLCKTCNQTYCKLIVLHPNLDIKNAIGSAYELSKLIGIWDRVHLPNFLVGVLAHGIKVAADCSIKQSWILRNNAQFRTQVTQTQCADVNTIDGDAARWSFNQPK